MARPRKEAAHLVRGTPSGIPEEMRAHVAAALARKDVRAWLAGYGEGYAAASNEAAFARCSVARSLGVDYQRDRDLARASYGLAPVLVEAIRRHGFPSIAEGIRHCVRERLADIGLA